MTFFVRKIPFTCQNFFAENTKTQKHKKPSRFLRLYYFLILMKYKGEMAYSFKRAALKKASFFLLVCCFFL